MSEYPEEVVLEKGSPEYEFLMAHSGLLKEMIPRNVDRISLGPWLFSEEQDRWQLFYDLFFPASQVNPVFVFEAPTRLGVAPRVAVREDRGTMDDVRAMFDYLLIGDMHTVTDLMNNIIKLHYQVSPNVAPFGDDPVGSRYRKRIYRRNYGAILRREEERRQADRLRRMLNRMNAEIKALNGEQVAPQGLAVPKPNRPAPVVGVGEEEERLSIPMRKYLAPNLVSKTRGRREKKYGKKHFGKTRRQLANKKKVANNTNH